ncbi:MAG: hypothetical protein NT041_01470 [Candidatus Vogelbacteria bacterium]|nr:hypothetical protein [Candidatus Vogelbacteria bacterium]
MESMSQEWKNKIDEAVTTVNSNGSPVELTIRALNWPIRIIGNRGDIPSAHSVILVGLSGSEEQGYKFDIVDPNIPDKITYLENCRYSKLSITYDHKTDEYFGLGCSPLDIVVYPKAGPVFIRYIDDKGSSAIRASVHKNFCNQSGNNNYRDLCSRVKITDWLKNNLTKFENLPAGGGTCEAWSKFYLDMAYLGDFVGTDFSPGDGKFVSADGSAGCDMNHYPPAKKSVWLDSANWLGNVFSAWTKLWP